MAGDISVKNRNKLLAERVIKNLKARKFDAYYTETAQEAAQKVLSLIPAKASVSWGGTQTMEELKVLDVIRSGDYNTIDRDTAKTPEERQELMHKAFFSDVYLTSFNAMSEDGVLINIDGMGNRVAAIAYGPKSVIAVVSMNKICKTTESARDRARNYAAPVNVQRCNLNPHFAQITGTPCSKTGSCGDCTAADCICSYIVETRMSKVPGRIKIILVDEPLGI